MKRLFSAFLILMLVLSAQGALNFSANTHRVEFGSPAGSDGLTTITLGGWARFSSLTNSTSCFIVGKDNDPSFTAWMDLLTDGDNDRLFFSAHKATTDVNIQGTTNELVTNTWYFVAATADLSSTTNTNYNLYKGTITSSVAEVAGYAQRNAGSGSFASVDSVNWMSGNTANSSSYYSMRGDLAYTFVANKRMSLAELQIMQYRPMCYRDASGNGILHLWVLGHNGTAGVTDVCGLASTGTITGASVAATGVPIGSIWGL